MAHNNCIVKQMTRAQVGTIRRTGLLQFSVCSRRSGYRLPLCLHLCASADGAQRNILTSLIVFREILVVTARPVREKYKVCHATYFTLRFGCQYIDNVFAQSWKDMNMNRQIRSAGICKRNGIEICEAVLVLLLWKWIGAKSIAMFCRN